MSLCMHTSCLRLGSKKETVGEILNCVANNASIDDVSADPKIMNAEDLVGNSNFRLTIDGVEYDPAFNFSTLQLFESAPSLELAA